MYRKGTGWVGEQHARGLSDFIRDLGLVFSYSAEAVDPNDSLAALLRQKVEAKAKEAAMEVRVTEEMRVKMDTGVRVNPALAAHFGDSAPNPAPDREVIDIDLLVEGDKIELKSKRSRRCAFPLSSSDTSASTFLIW